MTTPNVPTIVVVVDDRPQLPDLEKCKMTYVIKYEKQPLPPLDLGHNKNEPWRGKRPR